jgi:hypothetical protein
VEDDVGAIHSPGREPFEKVRREVKSSRRRRDGPAFLCVDGLIPLGVGRLVGARDVRRERDVPVFFQRLIDGRCRSQANHPRSPLSGRNNLDAEIIRDADDAPWLELSSRMNHRFPFVASDLSEQQNLGGRAVVAEAEQSGAEHARRVEDESIARRDHFLEIAEALVRDLARRPVDDHQSTFAAPLGRLLRDSLGGQVEIVMRCAGAVLGHAGREMVSGSRICN